MADQKDVITELLAGGVSPELLAAELRKQRDLGLLGALSGSKRMAPVGAGLREEAMSTATGIGKARRDEAARKEGVDLDRLTLRLREEQARKDREQRAADAAANRALQRELAGMRAASAKEVAGIRSQGKGTGQVVTPEALAQQADEMERLAGEADKARAQSGRLSTGIFGHTSIVGGTPAANLRGRLLPLQSNEALSNLLALKQASKTGASGLGSVTEREIDLLINKFRSLEQTQSEDQLDEGLAEIAQRYRKIASQVRTALQQNPQGQDVGQVDPLDALMEQMLGEDPELGELLNEYGE